MAFGCKVHHCVRLVLGKKQANQFRVAYVALYQDVVRIVIETCKVIWIAGIGELVQIDDALAASPCLQDKAGAYEARSACNEKCFCH